MSFEEDFLDKDKVEDDSYNRDVKEDFVGSADNEIALIKENRGLKDENKQLRDLVLKDEYLKDELAQLKESYGHLENSQKVIKKENTSLYKEKNNQRITVSNLQEISNGLKKDLETIVVSDNKKSDIINQLQQDLTKLRRDAYPDFQEILDDLRPLQENNEKIEQLFYYIEGQKSTSKKYKKTYSRSNNRRYFRLFDLAHYAINYHAKTF